MYERIASNTLIPCIFSLTVNASIIYKGAVKGLLDPVNIMRILYNGASGFQESPETMCDHEPRETII